jgi:amidase
MAWFLTARLRFCPPLALWGAVCRDINLILKTWNDFEPWLYDPAVMAKKWEPVPTPAKATIGVMYWDEVVMPHPPVQRG